MIRNFTCQSCEAIFNINAKPDLIIVHCPCCGREGKLKENIEPKEVARQMLLKMFEKH